MNKRTNGRNIIRMNYLLVKQTRKRRRLYYFALFLLRRKKLSLVLVELLAEAKCFMNTLEMTLSRSHTDILLSVVQPSIQ